MFPKRFNQKEKTCIECKQHHPQATIPNWVKRRCAGRFCVILTLNSYSQLGRGNFYWGNLVSLWASLWYISLIDGWCGRAQITVDGTTSGLGVYKKAGWTSHGEQSCKQCYSKVIASVPASKFLPWVPALTSLGVGLWPERDARQNKPLPPWTAFGHDMCHGNRNPTKTKQGRRKGAEDQRSVLTSLLRTGWQQSHAPVQCLPHYEME